MQKIAAVLLALLVFHLQHDQLQGFRLSTINRANVLSHRRQGVSDLKAVIDPDHVQQLSNFLSSSLHLADAAVSAYSKVDKTGVIGFFATYIELGIDLGKNIFQGIGIQNAYGPSILLFTIIVKLLTFPLQYQTLESTTKLQKIQPFQQKILDKYANDPQTKNLVLSQLLQAAKVNPLAGCFPALVQIPIFISLYRALTNLVAENKLAESFLWIPDLQGPVFTKPPAEALDWIKSIFTGNPELGWETTIAYLTIPVLLFITQSISQKLLQPPKDPNKQLTDQEKFSQQLVNNLPFIITFFSLSVPAGLEVYWIANNIISTIVTLAVKNSLRDEPFPPEVAQIMASIETPSSSAVPEPSFENRGFKSMMDDRPKPSGFGKGGEEALSIRSDAQSSSSTSTTNDAGSPSPSNSPSSMQTNQVQPTFQRKPSPKRKGKSRK